MSAHHHHGNVLVGRIIVLVGCLIILGINYKLFTIASWRPPLPAMKGLLVISMLWMFAGAGLTIGRVAVGRYMALTILYAASFGLFVTSVISNSLDDRAMAIRLRMPTFFAAAVYLIISLVFTYSRHIYRLTSRAFE
jgi:hypothetical protein